MYSMYVNMFFPLLGFIKLGNRSHIHGRWGKCSKRCPIHKAETEVPSNTKPTEAKPSKSCRQCKFPFVMEVNGREQNGCVHLKKGKLGDHSPEFWCPTQLDEHRRPTQENWVQCTKDCEGHKRSGTSSIQFMALI